MEEKIIKPYTEERKKELQAQYGERNIVETEIVTEDGYTFGYLVKRPSKTVIQAITELEGKPTAQKTAKDITSITNLMEGCVLEGDKKAYEDDAAIFTQLMKSVGQLLHQATANLKK